MTASTTAPDRAEISRRNGRRSRGGGPRTPEGKQRSRMNAVKHGMTARLPVLPGEDQAEFHRHVDGFLDALQPRDAVELALAEQAALATWKIARAERSEAGRVAVALRAAEAADGLETHDEVAAMGHWLRTEALRARQDAAKSLLPFLSKDRHDPFERGRGDPRHIVLRLEATAAGCRWLLGQWARLGERLERGSDWRTNELILALQLRGQRPLGRDCLEWQGVIEPIPEDGDAQLVAEVRRRLRLQFEEGLPDDPAERRAALLRLVREEMARLDEREAGHQRREAADRAELADRLAVDTTAEGERMRRYQLDFDRKLHRALASLLKLRRGEGVGGAGDPAPDRTPQPDPPPGPAGMDEPEHPGAGVGLLPVLSFTRSPIVPEAREGEPPGESRRPPARTEPRPPEDRPADPAGGRASVRAAPPADSDGTSPSRTGPPHRAGASEHPTTPRSWAPITPCEPELEPVGTVESQCGPAGEAEAGVQPEAGGRSPEAEDRVAGGLPSAFLKAAEPAPVATAAATGPAAEPEGDTVAQNEPCRPAGRDPLSRDGFTGSGRIADWPGPGQRTGDLAGRAVEWPG